MTIHLLDTNDPMPTPQVRANCGELVPDAVPSPRWDGDSVCCDCRVVHGQYRARQMVFVHTHAFYSRSLDGRS